MSSGKEQSVDLKLSPLTNKKILESEGTAPKAIPEDTSDVGLGEDGMPLNPSGGEPGVQFISPGRDPANGDAKVEIGANSGVPHFVGLGKEELMKYANDPFWVRLRWILFALFWLIWLAMLVGAIIIIVLAPKCQNKALTTGQTIVSKNGPYYQIFLRSFSPDGTFSGLEQKIPYLKSLDIKTVIISQFLDTKGKSDVSDVFNFEAIDSAYGLDYDGFKKLVEKFNENGLKILLQFIPNHSGKSHPWFKTKPEYYVLKKKLDFEKINSNISKEKHWSVKNRTDPESDYYFHQFTDNLPDLNYKNQDVINKMNNILKKWYLTGVDGFLLSDVSYLAEDLENPENQESSKLQKENLEIVEALINKANWGLEKNQSGPYTLLDLNNLPTKDIFDTYSKNDIIPVIADWAVLPEDFNETQLQLASDSNEFVLRRLSSPRLPRLQTRFGSPRANILAMVSFLLRGEVVLYYGEELGMTSDERHTLSNKQLEISIQTVDWTSVSTNKHLDYYNELIKLHNNMNQTINDGGTTQFHANEGIFAFKRETAKNYVVVTNLHNSEMKVNVKKLFNINKKDKLHTVSVTPGPGLQAYENRTEITADEITLPSFSGIVLEVIKTS